MESLTARQVTEALQISERTLYRWIRKGRIVPIGKRCARGAANLFSAAQVKELRKAIEILR